MSAATLLEVDLGVDLHDEVGCGAPDCENAARWVGVTRHDGTACRSVVACDWHRAEVDAWLDTLRADGLFPLCLLHDVRASMEWRPL